MSPIVTSSAAPSLARAPRSRPSVAALANALLGVALGVLVMLLPHGVRAQSLDTTLPEENVETGVLGEPQRIEADVGADATLSSIELYYRFDGETDYRQLPMRRGGVSGLYAASVPTENVRAERLEFHIVAEETNGGILLKGSAAEPLVRVLERPEGLIGGTDAEAAAGAVSPSGAEGVDGATSGNRKYLYIALGVLAVGALAAAAGDGGSSSEGCAPEGCRLTLTLPRPGE